MPIAYPNDPDASAFPQAEHLDSFSGVHHGLTARTYVATKMLAALVSNKPPGAGYDAGDITKALQYTDALLDALSV